MTWLSTHLQAAVAAQQCHRLCGVHALASPGGTLAWTRASAATVRVDVPSGGVRCCVVAPNMPRTALIGTAKGALCEPEGTNKVLYSDDLTQWTRRGTASVTYDQTGPGGLLASRVTVDGGANDVYSTCASLGAAGIPLAIAMYIRRLSTTGTVAAESPYNSGEGDWSFNLATIGAGWVRIDRSAAGVTVNAEYKGSSIVTGASGLLLRSEAGGSLTFDICLVTIAYTGTYYADSLIRTTGAAATRLADSAVYTLSSEIDTKQGMAKIAYDKGPTSGGAITALDISDGGSSADHVAIGIDASDHATAASAMTGGDAGATAGTTDVRDGAAHTIQATWQDDALTVYADGTADGTADDACDMPENLDTITIGPARQLITSVKIWTTNLAKAM